MEILQPKSRKCFPRESEPMIYIRKMARDDYERVHRLWLSTSGMGLNDRDDSKTGIEKYLLRNPGTCFVALEDDDIVGSILCGHDGRRGYLYHMAVASEKRHCGVGNALLEAALAALDQEGIGKAALVAFEQNRIGNRFWKNQGFAMRNDLVYRDRTLGGTIGTDR